MFKIYHSQAMPTDIEIHVISSFLADHLDEYGDPKQDIDKAVQYALGRNNTPGGFLVAHWKGKVLTGAVVVNKTGMQGYIPENILVYIATHKAHRGKGVGKQMMSKAIETAEGDIALHVEPDNPARKLYEGLGFTNKYLEMRLKKK